MVAKANATQAGTLLATLDLSGNRLHNVHAVLRQLSSSVRALALGNNNLNVSSCRDVRWALMQEECAIEALSLASNPLRDTGVRLIAEGIRGGQH